MIDNILQRINDAAYRLPLLQEEQINEAILAVADSIMMNAAHQFAESEHISSDRNTDRGDLERRIRHET